MKNRIRVAVVGITIALAASPVFAQTAGADTYKSKCAMCHGVDGGAGTPAGKAMKVPPFSSPDLIKAADADLISATKSGKGKMPAYSGKLTDPEIKDVIAYIRTLQKK
ncbi:mono/diheme cytochrome c family protein [Silvibacterium bohemicum]|uniref:Mono/diheme cytochrome c family protein n=1 Tax=Silvibacterium bohemicum TaxID=1577686 RepID=A0A841JQ68_9BACT|nr:cytochrome c [Silvibacterium bohemicum]MBB6143532.1 mono/diheme cytochrome c family protein [Silvibacterium bohemicum]